jgi:DNA-binding MarR family transcriptional regulator
MPRKLRANALNRLQTAARATRTALAARLTTHGFYAGQEQVMIALSQEEGLTPGQLATRLGVRPPTITKTVARLQAQGMVEKRNSVSDQRQAIIQLSEQGREAIRAIEKSIRKTEKQAFQGIDKKEQKQLSKLLARIEANLAGAKPAEEAEATEEEMMIASSPETQTVAA